MVVSQLPEASVLLSALNATPLTTSSCPDDPVINWGEAAMAELADGAPSRSAWRLTVPSVLPQASMLPSGPTATLTAVAAWVSRAVGALSAWRVDTSQRKSKR